jgi:hypothetical protein
MEGLMNKFEQLIEYVINDEDAKARELFHDIVVEKSRQIYEEMMEEDAITEESTEDKDEKAEKAGEKVTKDIEYDDKRDRKEKMDEDLGGDQADDLIDDIEVEEEGLSMEAEGDDDMDADEDLEDRVVDLEDKLDELMAEFEALMGDDKGEDEMDMEVDMDMDTPDMDAEEVVDDEMETEGMHGMKMPMEEAVELKAAPKPVTAEEGSVNKKAVYAVDSGAKGAVAKPTNLDQGGEAKGRPAPKAQDMGMTMQPDVKPATKPHLAQATGVNVKSPLPGQ